jgi:outer membrane biosynthesis protein TonB
MPATPVAIAAQTPTAPVLPASPRAASQPAPKPPEDAAPTAPMGAPESRPNPAAVVALPAHRDSKGGDVLAGWGWGTDSHQAITDDSDLDLPAQGGNRKLLIYLLGGGLVFTLMVVAIAFGFGGSKKQAPPKVAATQEWNGSSQPGVDTGSATAGSADTGSMVGSAIAGSADTGSAIGSAEPGSAMAGSADTGSAMIAGSAAAATTGAAGSAAAATTGAAGSAMVATTGSAAAATTGPINPYPDTPETPKVETPKVETPKVETPKKVEAPKKTETPKVAKKVETPKKTETPRTTKRVETPKTTRTETPKSRSESTKDADAAYRAGLQQFARGDTTGALASLRTSLAANPNYPPTWRGLGLVFEKLGEKDQARAAFKRYLQLAPSAGDAENIRNRLERLGS